LGIPVHIDDIVITGSIANYNWSRFSDIDVHILVDFDEIDENHDLVREMFQRAHAHWNRLHNIKVNDHEVEIYVQHDAEPHVSTGVYSILNDEWIVKPRRIEPHIDEPTALKKARSLQREIDKVYSLYSHHLHAEALDAAYALKEKIKRMRQAGLQRTGLFAPENLAFKMLRRSGHIEKLFDAYTGAYDASLSLDEADDNKDKD